MTLNNIKNKLILLKPKLHEQFGVSEIGVFGSWVRGEQKESSDIDVYSENARDLVRSTEMKSEKGTQIYHGNKWQDSAMF